jgi:hypothetical protein
LQESILAGEEVRLEVLEITAVKGMPTYDLRNVYFRRAIENLLIVIERQDKLKVLNRSYMDGQVEKVLEIIETMNVPGQKVAIETLQEMIKQTERQEKSFTEP